jgi:predicted metal-dependent hydrolase
VLHDPTAPRRPAWSDGAIRLGGPEESVPRRLRQWLEAEARRLLLDDLAHYCALADKPLPPLALSAANRRWGSCSARGNIRINWRLVMAPDWVRRSVVAHEVVHLVHFDHSREFHGLLARLYEGDIASANAWLKSKGRSLYGPFG